MKRSVIVAALLAGVPVVAAAGAQFEIGGIKVSTAEDGWEVSDAKGPSGQMGHGGIDATIPGEGKLLVMRDGAGQVLAALLVSASRGAPRPVTIRGTCPEMPPQRGHHAFKQGNPQGGPHACTQIAGPFRTGGSVPVFKHLHAAASAKGLAIPELAYFSWGYAIDQMGAMVNVEMVAADTFAGLTDAAPVTGLAEQVRPEIAAWGNALGTTLRKAHEGVFSRSTTLPPVRFAP